MTSQFGPDEDTFAPYVKVQLMKEKFEELEYLAKEARRRFAGDF